MITTSTESTYQFPIFFLGGDEPAEQYHPLPSTLLHHRPFSNDFYRVDTMGDLIEFLHLVKHHEVVAADNPEIPSHYGVYRHTGGGCWEIGDNQPYPESHKA